MTSTYSRVDRELRGHLLCTMIAALCVALAANPALAQEGAPAVAGADARPAGDSPDDGGVAMKGPDGAAATKRDIDLVVPYRGAAGLWRRANVKALIAHASTNKAAGLPAANTRIGPPQLPPRFHVSVTRNAIGVALPGVRPTAYDLMGVTPGARSPGIGIVAGGAGTQTTQLRASTNAGSALRGAAINGTAMSRMAAGSGSIGGPARDHAGINGTLMRPKH
jgi:hypothetical protein